MNCVNLQRMVYAMILSRVLGWEWPMAMKLDFTPTVSAGSLINGGIILCTTISGIVSLYLLLWSNINAVSLTAAKELAAVNARVLVLEAHRAIDDAFQTRTETKLDRVLERLGQLRSEAPGSAVWDKR